MATKRNYERPHDKMVHRRRIDACYGVDFGDVDLMTIGFIYLALGALAVIGFVFGSVLAAFDVTSAWAMLWGSVGLPAMAAAWYIWSIR